MRLDFSKYRRVCVIGAPGVSDFVAVGSGQSLSARFEIDDFVDAYQCSV